MANVTVRTSPPGAWPAETVEILDTTYAAVEADVLRRKSGDLLEQIDARDQADTVEKYSHAAPRITTQIVDPEATEADDDVAFTVNFSGDPAPEVNWYQTIGGIRSQLADNGGTIDIVTDADSSVLTFDDVTLDQDGTLIEVEVRNYKGTATSSATLSVAELP